MRGWDPPKVRMMRERGGSFVCSTTGEFPVFASYSPPLGRGSAVDIMLNTGQGNFSSILFGF